MTFCSNQANGRCVASVLTAVGASRVSIGPPIIVSVLGRCGFLSSFISAVAANAGNGRLADRKHMRPLARLGADQLQEFDEIIDIIVEIEAAVRQRHQLRVAPIGDVDVVVRQQPLDRAAQQGCIVARHRRDDEQRRAVLDALAIEMLQLAEGLAEQDFLMNADILPANMNRFDAEFGLAARGGGMGEDLQACRDKRPHRAVTPWVGRV